MRFGGSSIARTLLVGVSLFTGVAYSSGIVIGGISFANYSTADMVTAPDATSLTDPAAATAPQGLYVGISSQDTSATASIYVDVTAPQVFSHPVSTGLNPFGLGSIMGGASPVQQGLPFAFSNTSNAGAGTSLYILDTSVDPLTGLFAGDMAPQSLYLLPFEPPPLVVHAVPVVTAPVVFTAPAVGITANPEPSTFVLLLSGLAAAAIRWRKKTL